MKRRTAAERASAAVKTIVFLGLDGTQILDITGPFQVFVRAAEIYLRSHPKQKPPYTVLLASTTGSRTILTNCGLGLTATDTFRSLPAPIHTLLVAGGTEVEQETHDKELIAWLRKVSPRVQRLGSICTGAFLLAAAGLLDGKRVATHWKWPKNWPADSRKSP